MAQTLFPKPPPGMMFAKMREPSQQSSTTYKQGLNAYLSGDKKTALSLFKQAQQIDPLNMNARMGEQRVENKPVVPPKDISAAFYKSGLESYLSGDKKKASIFWTQAYSADQNNRSALMGLQRLAQEQGQVIIPQTSK